METQGALFCQKCSYAYEGLLNKVRGLSVISPYVGFLLCIDDASYYVAVKVLLNYD